jgi:hypothetical protein
VENWLIVEAKAHVFGERSFFEFRVFKFNMPN